MIRRAIGWQIAATVALVAALVGGGVAPADAAATAKSDGVTHISHVVGGWKITAPTGVTKFIMDGSGTSTRAAVPAAHSDLVDPSTLVSVYADYNDGNYCRYSLSNSRYTGNPGYTKCHTYMQLAHWYDGHDELSVIGLDGAVWDQWSQPDGIPDFAKLAGGAHDLELGVWWTPYPTIETHGSDGHSYCMQYNNGWTGSWYQCDWTGK